MRLRPWSAHPTLFELPNRITEAQRHARLATIEGRCEKTQAGCWLYPAVRDLPDGTPGYPYIDLTNDRGEREQWSAKRYVWALIRGDLPPEGIILRGCPQRSCVCPEHLELWCQPDLFGTAIAIPPAAIAAIGSRRDSMGAQQ